MEAIQEDAPQEVQEVVKGIPAKNESPDSVNAAASKISSLIDGPPSEDETPPVVDDVPEETKEVSQEVETVQE